MQNFTYMGALFFGDDVLAYLFAVVAAAYGQHGERAANLAFHFRVAQKDNGIGNVRNTAAGESQFIAKQAANLGGE